MNFSWHLNVCSRTARTDTSTQDSTCMLRRSTNTHRETDTHIDFLSRGTVVCAGLYTTLTAHRLDTETEGTIAPSACMLHVCVRVRVGNWFSVTYVKTRRPDCALDSRLINHPPAGRLCAMCVCTGKRARACVTHTAFSYVSTNSIHAF